MLAMTIEWRLRGGECQRIVRRLGEWRAERRQSRLPNRCQCLGKNLDLARWRGKAVALVFAVPRRERHADAPGIGAQSFQAKAAWREMVGESGIDVAVPEQVAQPEADREIEHDVEVGTRLTARRDDGGAKLHQLTGILIKPEADTQPLPLPGAGDWQYDIGKGGGRRQVEVGLDMEFEGAQRLRATRCVGVRQQQVGAKPNEAPHAVRPGV